MCIDELEEWRNAQSSMKPEDLLLLDEREREAWELCQKATPGPWFADSQPWKFGSTTHRQVQTESPNRNESSAQGGKRICATFAPDNDEFIAAARNLLEPLLRDKVRLTQELKIAADCVISLKERAEAAESERDRYKERVGVLEKFISEPFSATPSHPFCWRWRGIRGGWPK